MNIMKRFAGLLILLLAIPVSAQQKFSSPEKAVDAFVAAARAYDLPKLLAIFGKDSEPLFETGDPVADQSSRNEFLKNYDIKHTFAINSDGSKTLVVGDVAWPFPVPIIKSGGKWMFDEERGYDEVINRRIGKNELSAIQSILAAADAEREYYRVDRDGDGVLEYAQGFRSTVGLRNGLYWPASSSGDSSPLGQFFATATSEGYPPASTAYHGYRFRLLKKQGEHAPGGAYDYLVRDDQIGGFAIMAYPAEYGESGVMTFMVSHSGTVYQKDFGETTEADVWKIDSFDPDKSWTQVSPYDLDTIPEP